VSGPRTLLIVEDDELLRHALKEQLAAQGDFSVIEEALTGAAGIIAAKATAFDIILLDIGLPDMDGRDVCLRMREAGVRSPIIMLTAAVSEDDTITGLNAGASDCVTKPFRMAALLARMRTHLHQHNQSDDAVFSVGPYKFQPTDKMLVIGDGQKKILLTEKETAILKYLYRVGNKTVLRETLLGEVWGYNAAVTTHTLETHIYRLRQKIELEPSEAKLLVTEPGGYRLNP
jgi:DNA-binding response OmpR family regulator